MLLPISYLISAYPITPVEQLKPTLCNHFGISVYSVYFIQAVALACAARLTNATRLLETPFGRLTYIIQFSSIQ